MMKKDKFLKLQKIKRVVVVEDGNDNTIFKRRDIVLLIPHKSYHVGKENPSPDDLWRGVINDIRQTQNGKAWIELSWFYRSWDLPERKASKGLRSTMGHRELVFNAELTDIQPAESIEDHADIISFPFNEIGMVPFESSDFYYFRDATVGRDKKLKLDDPYICLDGCILHNHYISNEKHTAHVRWCESCERWIHENCAGLALPRSDIAPSTNQAYLTVDTMARKESMPSEVKIILGWPICRLSKRFMANDVEYWYPYSMEMCIQKTREWYREGAVPDNWRQCLMNIGTNEEFMKGELEALLAEPYPPYYRCPKCPSYYI